MLGQAQFLDGLRSALRDHSFQPLPVRERMIPKAGGKLRRLGIPTMADRVVQASLKLVLEPIFEADFLPCSYGFRPKRRAHDAVAEVRYLATRPRCYEWVVEGDIKACFDEIDHTALLGRVRSRIGDKRVLGLVKAFLKAGILTEDQQMQDTTAGTPQGGILSPLLANVALSVLDEFIAQQPGGPASSKLERDRRLRHGLPNFRLVRYADDWCLMVKGTWADAQTLQDKIVRVLATMGLTLSPDKTLITHIDEGLDFLGWRIQRHRKKGTSRHYVYVYPARKAVHAAVRKVKTLRRQVEVNQPLDSLLRRLNSMLRGWVGYFRHGVSSAVFNYLSRQCPAEWWNSDRPVGRGVINESCCRLCGLVGLCKLFRGVFFGCDDGAELVHADVGDVAAGDLPFVVGFHHDSGGQAEQRGWVGEDLHDVGAAFDFLVQTFQRVVRPGFLPMRSREPEERQHIRFRVGHHPGDLGERVGQGGGDLVPLGGDFGGFDVGEDRLDRGDDRRGVSGRDRAHHVAEEVGAADSHCQLGADLGVFAWAR